MLLLLTYNDEPISNNLINGSMNLDVFTPEQWNMLFIGLSTLTYSIARRIRMAKYMQGYIRL